MSSCSILWVTLESAGMPYPVVMNGEDAGIDLEAQLTKDIEPSKTR